MFGSGKFGVMTCLAFFKTLLTLILFKIQHGKPQGVTIEKCMYKGLNSGSVQTKKSCDTKSYSCCNLM